MKSGIYSITNKKNNKVYIGQAYDIQKRWNTHKAALSNNCHVNKHLQSAWNKYGEQNFDFKVIKYCRKEDLNSYEKQYIKKYNSNNRFYGYNKTIGGDNPPIFFKNEHHAYRNDIHVHDKDICNEYLNGYSYNFLSKKYNCNPWTIKNILVENNIEVRDIQQANKRLDVWEKQKDVCDYYIDGNSLLETSKKFNTSTIVVIDILKNNDIKTRSSKEINIGKRNSPKTEFKKGNIPHNKGKSKIALAGGINYIKQCIIKNMSRDDIAEELGYTSFKPIATFLSQNNTNFNNLLIDLGYKYNDTGYYRVSIVHRKNKNSYLYHAKDKKRIERVCLEGLEKAVKEAGYEWKKL